MAGFANGGSYMELTATQRKFAERLAEIEREDAKRCSNCGGEDCVCCEIYIDRMKWQESYDMFNNSDYCW